MAPEKGHAERAALVAGHAELTALAAQLAAATRAPAADGGLGALRWRMTRLLAVHLACEDRLPYPALRDGRDPRASWLAVAWRSYCADWPVERIAREWPRFGTETAAHLSALAG